ncbi:carboxypeptidase M32 [Vagococcus elongatus]|uniref:Metal-dependent carboxypeptidase n=1 Tax=Vagococcus elongatus TaxID=180344 RepID=A0A430B5V7_9ENTE|nr:carboxypeptidase M32 [Vagococcus elongatus]RSU15677.1 carboxypeptidase [Vagococcus elongatus]
MTEKEFLAYIKERELLKEANSLLYWDMATGMPEKAAEQRSELMSYMSGLEYDLSYGDKMTDFMTHFTQHPEALSDFGQGVFLKEKESFERNNRIDKERYLAFQKALGLAHSDWVKARKTNNFQDFKESLSSMISFTKEFIPLWQKDEATPYDVLLNLYEPGMTVEILDGVFEKLRKGIIEIRNTIAEKGTPPETDFLYRKVTKAQQQKFIEKVIADLGYDMSRGRLDDTIHPFELTLNHNDVRLTTRWDEEDFQTAVFGVIHEAGHGLYEQNIDAKYSYTPLATGTSMGCHESQSLFNEIIIGGSRAFWQKQYPYFQEVTEGTFDDIDFDRFYRGLKVTQGSLIRIEADSLTYPLHIIIRYEIEKMIFNDNIDLDDLPQIWNDKYEEYLGIRPETDLEGILQDSHWSGGSFGYFPSYALGFMYAAQFYHRMNQALDVEAVLGSDDYSPIIQWNKEHIHQYGASRKPNQLILEATGETMNPQYLLDFMKHMYFDAYQIEY